jgi:hypothetical protein
MEKAKTGNSPVLAFSAKITYSQVQIYEIFREKAIGKCKL